MTKVPDAPAATLGFVHCGGKLVQVQPAGCCAILTKVVLAGVFSVKVAVVAAALPVFVTACVYVIWPPACTGFGVALFVTVSSPPAVVPTTVLADAVLLAGFGSLTEEFTDAVSVITVPLAVELFTFTTSVKELELTPGMSTLLQTTLPVPPGPGVRQVQPAGAVIDTKVVFAGMVATRLALSAALGPLLVTTWVYVMLLPAATGFGEAASLTAMSAIEITFAVSVAVSFSRFASPPPPTTAVLIRVAGADCEMPAVTVIGL
jgi:hypothetical protein